MDISISRAWETESENKDTDQGATTGVHTEMDTIRHYSRGDRNGPTEHKT